MRRDCGQIFLNVKLRLVILSSDSAPVPQYVLKNLMV